MLFKPEHREMICQGIKTETRRPVAQPGPRYGNRVGITRRPAKPGVERGFYNRPAYAPLPRGRPFCRAEILTVDRQRLGAITKAGALAEGYESVAGYRGAWDRIYGVGAFADDCDRQVWVVKFRFVEQLACARCDSEEDLRPFWDRRPELPALYCDHHRAMLCLGDAAARYLESCTPFVTFTP